MGVNSLPKTVTRQRRGCDLNSTAPESSTLTTRLPSHPLELEVLKFQELRLTSGTHDVARVPSHVGRSG